MITGNHLITGLPGSGKTLKVVGYIKDEIAQGRAVYVCNLDGIDVPGVIPFDDPNNWQDLPPGSLLVIDEAQRFWRARRSGEIPPALIAMETGRHDSVALLMTTQQPGYLDKHLRGLVTRHEHLYRRMNAPFSQCWQWERCVEDPMSPGERDGASETIFRFPKQDFASYKSAEVHTFKTKMPFKFKLALAGLAVGLGILAWTFVPKKHQGTAAASGSAAVPQGTPAPAGAREPVMTSQEYFSRLTPRSETTPWSAPVFDKRQVQAEPELYCMAADAGTDAEGNYGPAHCSCLTEQGTKVDVTQSVCRQMAMEGPIYNPFRRPTHERISQAAQLSGPTKRDSSDTGSVAAGSASESSKNPIPPPVSPAPYPVANGT